MEKELDATSASGPTFPRFNDLPFELRDMIWTESPPLDESEVLEYTHERARHQWCVCCGPIVEVDFPVILHVCHESRSVALKHFFIRQVLDNYRPEDWRNKTCDHISHRDMADSNDMESMSELSSYSDQDSSTFDEDDRFDGDDEDFSPKLYSYNGHIEESPTGGSPSGDHGTECDLDESLAAPQPADEMSDTGSEFSDADSEDTSESEIPVARCYVACRHFRPELDYMFVDDDNLGDFEDVMREDKPWLPQHLALCFHAFYHVWVHREGEFAGARVEDCLQLKSVSVVVPSGGEQTENKGKHWQPRLKVNILEGSADFIRDMRYMFRLDPPTNASNWQMVTLKRIEGRKLDSVQREFDLLRCEGRDFIIKNAIDSYEGDFEYPQKLQAGLAACTNLRTMIDTVPYSKLYVYPFMTGDLLQFSQRPLSEEQRRYILKSALTGLAELHDRNIFHTDIKPNNILLDYKEEPNGNLVIQDVKLADLEDAVQLKPGTAIRGGVLGNKLWRSPEAWTGAVQGTPSDVFSFGVVAIYVMTNEMVFYYAFTDEQVTGDDAWRHILHRHVDLFAVDTEDLMGLLEHVGGEGSPWYDRIADIAGSFSKEEPRRPFALHTFVDETFRDLVVKMTNLDPKRRITAREALAHPWFTQTRPGRYYPSKA
ncbi:hypothetical protein VPNG_05086 [Cytospora leucostoma]|uniref:Protein kinase domain-containing protein n=1 Tax=Cytospora leucostoma TaxID=1230097 RepID=A0A423X4G4_9PEZI|nr:hypothetical protein VPNG_05086 [Cytospora leucostoma]